MVKMAFQNEPLKYSLAQFGSIYCNETFGCCCCCQTHFNNSNNHDVDDEVDVDDDVDDVDDDDGQENLIKYVALYDR